MCLQKYNGYPLDIQIREGVDSDLFFQTHNRVGLGLNLTNLIGLNLDKMNPTQTLPIDMSTFNQ